MKRGASTTISQKCVEYWQDFPKLCDADDNMIGKLALADCINLQFALTT